MLSLCSGLATSGEEAGVRSFIYSMEIITMECIAGTMGHRRPVVKSFFEGFLRVAGLCLVGRKLRRRLHGHVLPHTVEDVQQNFHFGLRRRREAVKHVV